jgi:hypothetical protein
MFRNLYPCQRRMLQSIDKNFINSQPDIDKKNALNNFKGTVS